MKREANYTPIFEKYLRLKRLVGAFEIKQTTSDAILFSAVEDHQIEGLLAVQQSGFVYKLSDADSRRKPFDVVATSWMTGYVVIKYPKITCVMTVNNFVWERDHSKRKSLTLERAKEISTYIVR